MDRWDLLDWRRRVAALYARVRATADPADGHALWVAGRDALIRTHPASPLPPVERERFAGTRVAPYDPAYRFVVPVAGAPPAARALPAGDDGQVALERVGRVALPGLGGLDVWWVGGYGGGLFLPVRDTTSGTASYGGGRYVLDTVKGADLGGDRGALVVDLNFAYQPSCAYHPSWVCPLPAAENTIAAAAPVGEQLG